MPLSKCIFTYMCCLFASVGFSSFGLHAVDVCDTKGILVTEYFPNYFELSHLPEIYNDLLKTSHVLFIIFAPSLSSEVLSKSLCPGSAARVPGVPSPVSHADPKRLSHCCSLHKGL